MADIWQITHLDLTIRLFLAAACGGMIGLEREWSNHAAGFRTHILVCMGSTAIMLLSVYGFSAYVNETNVRIDPARLAAQVISGIGFLGAGAIMRNGSTVSGLTTAASIWVVAAIGLCVGAGFFYCAIICTVIVLLCLFLLNKAEKVMMRGRRYWEVTLLIHDRPGSLGRIAAIFGERGIQIRSVNMRSIAPDKGKGESVTELRFRLEPNRSDQVCLALEGIPCWKM